MHHLFLKVCAGIGYNKKVLWRMVIMGKYEGLPFKVDERSTKAKRVGELWLTYQAKQSPGEMRFVERVASEVGPEGLLGGLEVQYLFFREHRQKGQYVGQCIGSEWLRRGNRINLRLRKASGQLEKRGGNVAGVPVTEIGERWVGDEHLASLYTLQAALSYDEKEWRKYLRNEAKPKTQYREKADRESKKYERDVFDEDAEEIPSMWVFNALKQMRGDIKDPRAAEALARYEASPANLDEELMKDAVRWYMQFVPHKAVGFQSTDNMKYLIGELHALDGSAAFKPDMIYKGTAEKVDTRPKPIEAVTEGEITLAQLKGALRAASEQLGMSLRDKQRQHNSNTIRLYFEDLGELPWIPYKESIGVLRKAVEQDKPIIRARLAHDEKAKESLPKRTRLGDNYRDSVRMLELIDKGLKGGKETEWQATLDIVPMRLAQPYVSAAFTVIQQERMRNG